MNFLVPIYQRKLGGQFRWDTLGGLRSSARGRSPTKMQQGLTRELRRHVQEMTAIEAARLCGGRSIRLERVRLDFVLRGARRVQITGTFPLIVEPRWTSEQDRLLVCYHPYRQDEWFPAHEDDDLAERASIYFREAWKGLTDLDREDLPCQGRDLLRVVAFDAAPQPLEELLEDDEPGVWADLRADLDPAKPGQPRALQVLPKIGVDLTPRAIEGSLAVGRPREPYREQLRLLLGALDKRSVLAVGPSGAGKTTIIHRLVADLLEQDDYPSHQNLDQVHHLWRISGKRLIAGMSHVGDWEERCGQLLEDLGGRKIILFIEDVQAFGRIGQTQQSTRSLADYFRGPLARKEMVVVAECTPEALARLEEDAPSFAALFTRLDVRPSSVADTYQLMFHEVRTLELERRIAFDVPVYRSVVELTGALYPSSAFPGKALDVVRALARGAGPDSVVRDERVVIHLSERTGLPPDLLRPQASVDPREIAGRFARRVIGQPEAVDVAAAVTLRVREGLTDPDRPYAVLLFTGPTGTGKTELAKAIAEQLYGSLSRMVRIDMSEMSGPDGPSRLMGDRFHPDGLLTKAVREQPFSVVLLDEVEKAHPSVLNLLLQLFDEGRLTDAAGQVADFRRAVVVMTSNLGARQRAAVGFDEAASTRAAGVSKAVKDFFPPELFNRIDKVVSFSPLDADTARRVADKELAALVSRRGLTARNVFVRCTRSVLDQVVREGFDADHGARTVKRYLEDHVGSLLTDTLTSQVPAEMRLLTLYAAEGALRVHDEALLEAEPADLSFTLDGAEDWDRARLVGAVEAATQRLERAASRGGRERLRVAIADRMAAHAAGRPSYDLHVLEEIRSELDRVVAPDGRAEAPDPDEAWDDYEAWGQGALPAKVGRQTRKGRHGSKDVDTTTPGELLERLEGLMRLRRLLLVDDHAGRHGVRVQWLQVGPVPAGGPTSLSFLEVMYTSYCLLDGVEVGDAAVEFADGAVRTDSGQVPEFPGARPVHVAFDLVGPGIADRLAHETGTHAHHALAEGTQLAMVRVGPIVEGTTVKDEIEQHRAQREAFEVALEAGQTPLPDNPGRLLPLTRRVRFAPSSAASVPHQYSVEDYRLGTVITRRTSQPTELLQMIQTLLASREGDL